MIMAPIFSLLHCSFLTPGQKILILRTLGYNLYIKCYSYIQTRNMLIQASASVVWLFPIKEIMGRLVTELYIRAFSDKAKDIFNRHLPDPFSSPSPLALVSYKSTSSSLVSPFSSLASTYWQIFFKKLLRGGVFLMDPTTYLAQRNTFSNNEN